ncbi:Usp domain-containing protein [Citrus sinensis]|uniref:universal stress protein A-like protein isoform X1 n=1 Tax=Citrus sinensis TaxID=2711 RepID=UPI0003D71918|nr:universal stress protein A-like protein isoform X1 [Citrus sinensis]KAH9674151.1 Usp domain-containing protein [Citrus sinensis]
MEKETVPGGSGSAMLQSKEEEEPKMTDGKKKMKVMVAIDESAESFNALKWALDNLYGIVGFTPEAGGGGGILTIVHVQEPFQRFVLPALSTSSAFYATSSMVESVRKSQEENSAALLSRALQMCKDKMVKAESLVLEGDPKDMICQSAEQMHIDLLVVGSRGLGKIKRAFLGSVSDYCAHHTVCPIIIVKPPKEQHE